MCACFGVYIHPEELDEIWIDEASSAGIGLVAFHPTGGENTADSFERFLHLTEEPGFQSLMEKMRQKGILAETAAHALSWLLPREEFEAHPDWFRMDETGNRVKAFNCCPSSLEAMAYLEDRAAALVGKIPADGHRYHLWTDDVAVGACSCERCKGLTPADQSLLLTHAILRGLRRADPEAKLSFLAYHSTMELPSLMPDEGVYLEYAPMDREYDKPLTDPNSEKNRKQWAPVSALLERFGKEDATVLDYWYDNSLQSGWKKPPVKLKLEQAVMEQDVRDDLSAGFAYITTFACYLGADYRALYPELPDLAALTKAADSMMKKAE